jgi:hypothetical protein
VSCGSVCANALLTVSSCDSQGDCVAAAQSTACAGNLACQNGTTCNTSCVNDAGCKSGYHCAPDHTCAVAGPAGVTPARCLDDHTSLPAASAPDAGGASCAPYHCDGTTGACETSCKTVADCLPPDVCGASGQCVAPPSTGSSSSCAMAPGPSTPGRGLAFIGALGLSLVTSRLRRKPRRVERGWKVHSG